MRDEQQESSGCPWALMAAAGACLMALRPAWAGPQAGPVWGPGVSSASTASTRSFRVDVALFMLPFSRPWGLPLVPFVNAIAIPVYQR